MLRQVVTGLMCCIALSPAVGGELSGDIELAQKGLETIHPGYSRYTDKAILDAQWAEMEALANSEMTRAELYVALSALLADIRCDHTKAELPKDMEEARNTELVYLPFRFKLFDGRMYVDLSSVDSLARGEEILAIDGNTVAWWLSSVEGLIPVDGDTDHVKASVIEYSSEFMGGALDHFAPLIGDTGSTARLSVRGLDGSVREQVVERLNYIDYQALSGEKRYSRNFTDAVRFATLGRDGAYLAVDTFVNYRQPVDPVLHMKPYFQQLEEEGRSKLIVDLRKNGGGSNDAQTALLRYLIGQPVVQVEEILTRTTSIDPDIRPHINTWDQAALDPDPSWFEPAGDGFYRVIAGSDPTPDEPLPHAFEGEVVFLTGPVNASGVTHMLATLKNHGGFTFVGEKTGGAPTGATANVIFFLTLPTSGIRIRVPVQRTLIANREHLPQRDGIAPDVAVTQTAADYFDGIDRSLDVARATLDLE